MMDKIFINHGAIIEFDYTYWEGNVAKRKCQVMEVYFGNNEYHQDPQWILRGWDLEKDEMREYAMKDMNNIKRV
jgi:hypothetical protein